MSQVTIGVKGMSCQGCVGSVTRVLEALPGVRKVEVSLEQAQARVDYEDAQVAVQTMKQAIEDAGFEAA